MGDHEAAQRSLAYIERNHLRADGDLEPVNGRNLRERYPLYPHAHVALGAVLADRADVTDRILEFLSRHRHPELGAWGDRGDGRQARRFDAISTSSVALAFLERGRLDEADAAARFLENLLDIQPNPGTEFLTTVLGSGELLTEFPDALVATDRRVKLGARFQVWHAIGFPLAFLARLLEVSGDEHWLHVANRYLSLLDRSAQSWTDLSTGKSAWGCAVLYRVTGEPGYRERALRALRALVALQAGDGGMAALHGW